jgi:hypothetical protein
MSSTSPKTYSTNYQRWNSKDRALLFQKIRYTEIPRSRPYFWAPKFTNPIEDQILGKLLSVQTTVGKFCANTNSRVYYRTTGGRYWKVFTDFAPSFKVNGRQGHSTRETWFTLAKSGYVKPMVAALSSDVFWWWYTNCSSIRDVNPIDIRTFPIPEQALNDSALASLGAEYLKDIQRNSSMAKTVRPTGKTETQTFKIQKSKAIIEKIDAVLSKHYGFDLEQLDFVKNYDIKFRMSDSNEDNVEE